MHLVQIIILFLNYLFFYLIKRMFWFYNIS